MLGFFHYPPARSSPFSREGDPSWLRKRGRKMDKHYVSEFTVFMDEYLKEHPEVVKDQEQGWNIYWNPKRFDLDELNSLEHPWDYDS
jgi:hypothetical protein